MDFSRTLADLERLQDKKSISHEELFGVFYDFCSDVKSSSGTPISELETGGQEGLIKTLPWISNIVQRSYSRIEDSVDSSFIKEKMDKLLPRLQKADEETEAAAEGLKALKTEERELDKKLEALELVRKEGEELKAGIRLKTQEQERLSSTDIPALKSRIAELDEKISASEQEFSQLKSELSNSESILSGKDNELCELKNQNSSLIESLREKDSRISEKRAALSNLEEAVSSKLLSLGELDKLIEVTSLRLDEIQEEIRLKDSSGGGDSLKALQKAVADREAQKERLDRVLKELEDAKGELNAGALKEYELNTALQNKNAELSGMKDRINNLEGKIKSLQSEIDETREILSAGNRGELENKLSETLEALKAETEELKALETGLEAKIDEKQRLEDSLSHNKGLMEEYETENSELELKISESKDKIKNLELQKERSINELKRIKGLLDREGLQNIENYADLLDSVLEEFRHDSKNLRSLYPELSEDADFKELAAADVGAVKERLRGYDRKYKKILDIIENNKD